MTHTKNDEKNTISSSRIHNLLSLLIRSQQLLDPTLAPVRVHLSAPAQNKSIVIQIQKQTWTISDQTKARKPRSPHYARCLLSCDSLKIPRITRACIALANFMPLNGSWHHSKRSAWRKRHETQGSQSGVTWSRSGQAGSAAGAEGCGAGAEIGEQIKFSWGGETSHEVTGEAVTATLRTRVTRFGFIWVTRFVDMSHWYVQPGDVFRWS